MQGTSKYSLSKKGLDMGSTEKNLKNVKNYQKAHFDKTYNDLMYAKWRLDDSVSFFYMRNIITSAMGTQKDGLNTNNSLLLDMGCGQGVDSVILSDYSKEIIGVDISMDSLKLARTLSKNYNSHRNIFLCSDVEQLPFKNNSFDKVFCMNLLHHLENPQKALEEAKRVLKVGGNLLVVEMNTYDIQMNIIARLLPHERYILRNKRKYIKNLFENLEMADISIQYKEFVFQPFVSYKVRKKLPFTLISNNLIIKLLFRFIRILTFILEKTPVLNKFTTYIIIRLKKP